MDRRGNWSGPFETYIEAEDRAKDIAAWMLEEGIVSGAVEVVACPDAQKEVQRVTDRLNAKRA